MVREAWLVRMGLILCLLVCISYLTVEKRTRRANI